MRGKLKHLPKPVARTILGFYYRRRFYEFLRALIAPLLVYAALALIAMHMDRFLFLETPARLWISGFTYGISLLVAVLSLWAFLFRRTPVSSLAYELERMLPKATAERLVTLNDILARAAGGHIAANDVRASLVEQLTGETVTICEGTPHSARLARDRRLKNGIRALVVFVLAWAALFTFPAYQFPLMLQRLTWPNRNLPKPSFMRLTVTPEAPVVGRGNEVVLQVQVEGAIPRFLRTPMRWLGADAGVSLLATAPGAVEQLPVTGEARPMSRVQSRLFVASLSDLQESFSYRVRCGDAQTDIRFARVVAQPRATDVSVEVVSPAYTELPVARYVDLRDPVPAFTGSQVQLQFVSDQSPLKAARLMRPADGETIRKLEPEAGTGIYRYTFEMAAPLELEIELENEFGFKNVERVRIVMALREDQPPGVRMEYPAGELSAAQGDLIPVHVELTDDLGLQEGAVCYQVNPGRNSEATTREIPLPVEPKQLSQSISTMFDLEKIGVVPGDEVLLWARGRDTGRSDESSQTVRIHVTAFGGNENERRRLAALRFVGQALTIVEAPAGQGTVLTLNEEKYEPIAVAANAQDLELGRRPAPESLLRFLEREHHFTDGAGGATEVRMLYGMISALFRPPQAAPASAESRMADLRKLAEETLPALMRERMGRDLIRRALNLRTETLATVEVPDAGGRKSRATHERRVDLLQQAFDDTGADIAALARMSQQINIDELLSFTRQISRTSRDLKNADPARQEAAGKNICEQIDGWIRLLLPPLGEWKAQRLVAHEALIAQYDAIRGPIENAWQTDPGKMTAAAARWLADDARMVERSPFLGLAERIAAAAPPGVAVPVDASGRAAMDYEAGLLSSMAVESGFADWLASTRVTPSERRLAAALKALDSASDTAARTAAADLLRTLNIDDNVPVEDQAAALSGSGSGGFYAHLSALTGVATAMQVPHDEALEMLAARTGELQDMLTQFGGGPDGGEAAGGIAGALGRLESGLAQWEADAVRLSYRVHLDLAYGDPSREQTTRLAATLPALRDVLDRYRVQVAPLLGRIKDRAGQASAGKNLASLQLDLEELVRHVKALGAGLKKTAKLFRGEIPTDRESGAVRDIRICYSAARKLADTDKPAAVAAAFFAEQPGAAAIVLEQRMPMLKDLQGCMDAVALALPTETATGATFRDAMPRAAQIASDFEKELARFAALDADGAVRSRAAEIRKRAQSLVDPGRAGGAPTLERDRLAVDELQRLVKQFEDQVREMIARNAPALRGGWGGGPEGIWGGSGRRDAEHARSRMMEQFERARRDAVLGFDALITGAEKPGAPLPDAPLAGSLFAWRTLHSSIGGATMVRRPPPPLPPPDEELVRWLLSEIEEMRKALRGAGVVRRFGDATSRWVDSAAGKLRH